MAGLAFMVFRQQGEINQLKSTTTTLSQLGQLLSVAEQDPVAREFIGKGSYETSIDTLDESDFSRMPAIYKNLTDKHPVQLNLTRGTGSLLVIIASDKVMKVVPVTSLRIT